MHRQIFGRQPVAVVAAIQSVLLLLVSFGGLSWAGLHGVNDVALAVAVLSGLSAVYLALGTTETILAPVIETLKAVIAFAAIYGLNLTDEQSGLAVIVITTVLALVHQGKTTPQATLAVDPVNSYEVMPA